MLLKQIAFNAVNMYFYVSMIYEYLTSLYFLIITTSLSVSLLIYSVWALFRFASGDNDRSAFECGLSSLKRARVPFSLRFFLLCIIFIIFDVEILLLVPVVWVISSPSLIYAWPLYAFVIILAGGLYHELTQGCLQWQDI